jgi:hypothetical protein
VAQRFLGRLLRQEVASIDRAAAQLKRHPVGAPGAAVVAHDREPVDVERRITSTWSWAIARIRYGPWSGALGGLPLAP